MIEKGIGTIAAACWMLLLHWGGNRAARWGYAGCIVLLGVASGIGATMQAPWQYWVLQGILGVTSQGTLSLSRSLLASLTPPHLAATSMALKAGDASGSGFIGLTLIPIATLHRPHPNSNCSPGPNPEARSDGSGT